MLLRSRLTALCGVLGTVALVIYFSTVLVPLPPQGAPVAQVLAFADHYHNAILLDVWLQQIGTLLTVVFVLALAHLSGADQHFCGRLLLPIGSVLMTLSLAEGTFSLVVLQAATQGHAATAMVGYDLTNVFVHIFLIAPSLFVVLGIALWDTTLLPPLFSRFALALGLVFTILGFVGLFNTTAQGAAIGIQIGQELWILAASVTVLRRSTRATDPLVRARPQGASSSTVR